jgi:hypothetical protein
MFYLGLIAAVCYVPGYTGASVPSQWVFASLTLPFVLRHPIQWTKFHSLMLAFAGWGFFSLLWTPSAYDGLYELWIITLWLLAFRFGTVCDLRELFRGLAVGVSVSTAVAVAQALGYHPVPTDNDAQIAGLFYNSTMLGAVAALTALGCVSYRLRPYAIAMLPAIALSHSRGALVALAIGLAARFVHWTILAGVVLAAGTALLASPSSSDSMRIEIWSATLSSLAFFGNGIGAFDAFYFFTPTPALIHPEFAHNDLLQLWFNYGPAGLIPIAVLGTALWRGGAAAPVLAGVAVLALFWFPLWSPLPSLLAFACAGVSLRGYNPDWASRIEWGHAQLSRADEW